MRPLRCLLLLLFLLAPGLLPAQVLPPPVLPPEGSGTLPATTCVNSVGTGLTPQGVLVCGPVTPAMTTGLAPTGDVSATWQVTATHLALPLPPAQGGTGLASGPPGGLLYFSGPTTLGVTPAFPQNVPLLGGGVGAGPVAGTRSGTTLELATILGPHVVGKQLNFDALGNIVASEADVGAHLVSSVFGRVGAIIPQAGDYTATQVTNAADLTVPNVFVHAAGQTMPQLNLSGTVSGTLSLKGPAAAGASVLTFPSGSLDFTTTGGSHQVVRQSTPGGSFSVSQLGFANLAGSAAPAQLPALQDLTGVVPATKGGLGWTDTTWSGPSHVLATVQGPLPAGMGVTVDALGNLITTGQPPGGGDGGNGAINSGGPGTLTYYATLGTTVSDSGIVAGQVVTAPVGFTVGRVLQAAGNNRTVGDSGILISALCTNAAICSGYQAALGFTPEDSARKNPSAVLGTSNTDYPTQGAVKNYVDTGLATRQALVTWGPGLVFNAGVASVGSTQAGFLTDGGATALVCGPSNQGKLQVMNNGELQFCDGAVTALLHSGTLTPTPLRWNVTASACHGDANAGKLTVTAANEITCASDIGGPGGGGGVTSVFGRTGAVVATPGDYTASQVTNAADLVAPNVFTHSGGQSMAQMVLLGSTSGTLTLRAPAVAGTSSITWPLGTTNLTTTGGPGQVLRQSSLGGAVTVSQLSAGDLSNGVTGTGAIVLATNPQILALANLTTNGLVRTTGGVGTLIVDAAPYLTANQAITLSGDATGTGTTAIPVSVTRLNGGLFAGTSGQLVSFGAGNTPADSGLLAAQVPTAASPFVSGNLVRAAGNNRTLMDAGIAAASVCTTGSVCGGYQAALGFTAVPDTRTLTLQGTANQVTVAGAPTQALSGNVSWTLSLPQDLSAGSLVRHASFGLNVAAPAGAGQLSQLGGSNGLTLHTLRRATDTAPTGAFADYQSAAGASLWTVDITGTLIAGVVPVAQVSGAVPSTRTLTLTGTANQIAVSAGTQDLAANRTWTLSFPANLTLPGTTTGSFSGPLAGNATTASALFANPPPCGANLFVTDIAANGTLACTQPAFSNLSGSATAAQLPTALADGTTRGVAAFVATDFDCTVGGVCSLDYAAGPERVSNKSADPTLAGTASQYPTVPAVKTYVDTRMTNLVNEINPCRQTRANLGNAGQCRTVSATALTVIAASATRCAAVIVNTSPNPMMCRDASDGVPTATAGWRLPPGQWLAMEFESQQQWQCIRTTAADAEACVLEAIP